MFFTLIFFYLLIPFLNFILDKVLNYFEINNFFTVPGSIQIPKYHIKLLITEFYNSFNNKESILNSKLIRDLWNTLRIISIDKINYFLS